MTDLTVDRGPGPAPRDLEDASSRALPTASDAAAPADATPSIAAELRSTMLLLGLLVAIVAAIPLVAAVLGAR